MKKYLMTGMAAVAICAAFTSCSKEKEIEPLTPEQLAEDEIVKIQNEYEDKFYEKYGEVSGSQSWGFTADHARTRAENANANEWADVSNNTGFGGWLVPDPLTEGQKERVKAFFQANPNLGYTDPHWTNFFVQQVYKGGPTTAGENSPEQVVAADGSKYTSDNMNHMTVGQSEVHINNFNGGDASEVNVLDNGANIKENTGMTYHTDKIMLMVNIDDTSCFGYHDSGSSNQEASPNHNDKAALVSAATIDAWAAQNGNPGEAVTDKWNRSFLGFDLAIKEGDQTYEKDANGNVIYASYSQAAESPMKAWDGEKIIDIADPTKYYPIEYYDAYKTIYGVGFLTTNKNFYIAEDAVTMPQTLSMNRAQTSTITTIQDAPVLKDVMDGNTYYQSVINLPRIKQLVDGGYLPVNNKNLTEWVKVGKSDGFFSDWIVTVTDAQKAPTPTPDPDPVIPTPQPSNANIRIIAEDLSVTDIEADFDFNDVVFDVYYGDASSAYVMVLAAGGTLPLKVNGVEVHGLMGQGTGTMINTGASTKFPGKGADGVEAKRIDLGFAVNNAAEADNIKIEVQKNGHWVTLTAQRAKAAAKMAVGTDYDWCSERQNIEVKYSGFINYVNHGTATDWNTWYK